VHYENRRQRQWLVGLACATPLGLFLHSVGGSRRDRGLTCSSRIWGTDTTWPSQPPVEELAASAETVEAPRTMRSGRAAARRAAPDAARVRARAALERALEAPLWASGERCLAWGVQLPVAHLSLLRHAGRGDARRRRPFRCWTPAVREFTQMGRPQPRHADGAARQRCPQVQVLVEELAARAARMRALCQRCPVNIDIVPSPRVRGKDNDEDGVLSCPIWR